MTEKIKILNEALEEIALMKRLDLFPDELPVYKRILRKITEYEEPLNDRAD